VLLQVIIYLPYDESEFVNVIVGSASWFNDLDRGFGIWRDIDINDVVFAFSVTLDEPLFDEESIGIKKALQFVKKHSFIFYVVS
jgi:hypothetical protein